MKILIQSLIGALVISLLSLVGIIFLLVKEKFLNKILLALVSFSAGALLGGAFFHLMPEAIEISVDAMNVFKYVTLGLVLFFLLERVLRWHHCHEIECDTHKHLGFLNLVGDGVHNFIDGLIIISAFSVSSGLGIPILISLALHEIPQEIGDFGVLIYAGFSKTKAIVYNLISALLAVAGVLVGYFLIDRMDNLNNFLLPFAAGGFIYIAASDLIPELHKEKDIKKVVISFLMFVLALIFMFKLV